MIIARDNDSSTTLPPGTKFWVRLLQNVTVTQRAMPVIGVIIKDVESSLPGGGGALAIPQGAQVFGEGAVDHDSGRASLSFKSIILPDARSMKLSGLALGEDNQAGVDGHYHSDAVKNTAGIMISNFVTGLAEGSITRTPFGASQGGLQNGLLQGATDTAKERTQAWSEDWKKPKEWIELDQGTQFQVILSEPFIFREPGTVR
jgi:type IV secretory pathway VirB10-like protein